MNVFDIYGEIQAILFLIVTRFLVCHVYSITLQGNHPSLCNTTVLLFFIFTYTGAFTVILFFFMIALRLNIIEASVYKFLAFMSVTLSSFVVGYLLVAIDNFIFVTQYEKLNFMHVAELTFSAFAVIVSTRFFFRILNFKPIDTDKYVNTIDVKTILHWGLTLGVSLVLFRGREIPILFIALSLLVEAVRSMLSYLFDIKELIWDNVLNLIQIIVVSVFFLITVTGTSSLRNEISISETDSNRNETSYNVGVQSNGTKTTYSEESASNFIISSSIALLGALFLSILNSCIHKDGMHVIYDRVSAK